MTLAFLYNVRHQYPDPYDSRSQIETDFDDPATIKFIIKHFKKCGYEIIPIEANEKAYLKLYRNKGKIDLVFNFSEGIYGYDREAQIPAMLEMLKIPYTGSRPLTQAIGLNKAKTKEILLANNIATLPFQLIKNVNEKLNIQTSFPLIVKPVAQGSGAGITNKSVVRNERQLKEQINFIINTFAQGALIEPFIDGREFSVAMIGNPPQILPIIEADHSLLPKEYLPLDSLEVKWIFEEQSEKNHLKCPAPMTADLKDKVENLCHKTWQALEVRDWCRIDIRCDRQNNPYILEINSPVGLLPPEVSMTSYMPLAAREAGIDYDSLLKLIINTALKRYGKA
ncbi:MAG: ATP-grasp domain-containing protein [bacterium]